MKGCDQADVGDTIQPRELRVRMVLLDVADRPPLLRRESGIDAIHLRVDEPRVFAILLNGLPCRSRDLEKRRFLRMLRVLLKQEFERLEPLEDAFRVIESVYAEYDLRGLYAIRA